MGDIKLGIMPAFKDGVITDPRWCHEFAEMVEAEGVESIWTVEHVVVAKDYEPRYSYSANGRMPGASGTVMPDPLEMLAFFASCTERVRLGTAVLVLTLHQPAVVAKRVATIDNLSNGRVSLGVGSGWQIEEYRACGVPYDGGSPARRGDRRVARVVDARLPHAPGRVLRVRRLRELARAGAGGWPSDHHRRIDRDRGAGPVGSVMASIRTSSRPKICAAHRDHPSNRARTRSRSRCHRDHRVAGQLEAGLDARSRRRAPLHRGRCASHDDVRARVGGDRGLANSRSRATCARRDHQHLQWPSGFRADSICNGRWATSASRWCDSTWRRSTPRECSPGRTPKRSSPRTPTG